MVLVSFVAADETIFCHKVQNKKQGQTSLFLLFLRLLPVTQLSSVVCRTHHPLGPNPRTGLTSRYTEGKNYKNKPFYFPFQIQKVTSVKKTNTCPAL